MSPASTDDAPAALGIVGGAGPVASAEFVRSIYELAPTDPEQLAPVVILHSDPRLPPRPSVWAAGAPSSLESDLVGALEARLDGLVSAGAHDLVICCITLHHLLPRLRVRAPGRLHSLIDIGVAAIDPNHRYLMLSSDQARRLEIYQHHPSWPSVQQNVAWLGATDQMHLEGVIARIKSGADWSDAVPWLRDVVARYDADGVAIGCSEMHVLAKRYRRFEPTHVVADPFHEVARGLTHDAVTTP